MHGRSTLTSHYPLMARTFMAPSTSSTSASRPARPSTLALPSAAGKALQTHRALRTSPPLHPQRLVPVMHEANGLLRNCANVQENTRHISLLGLCASGRWLATRSSAYGRFTNECTRLTMSQWSLERD